MKLKHNNVNEVSIEKLENDDGRCQDLRGQRIEAILVLASRGMYAKDRDILYKENVQALNDRTVAALRPFIIQV